MSTEAPHGRRRSTRRRPRLAIILMVGVVAAGGVVGFGSLTGLGPLPDAEAATHPFRGAGRYPHGRPHPRPTRSLPTTPATTSPPGTGGTTSSGTGTPSPTTTGGETQTQVITIVNTERSKAGCGPLTADAALTQAAQNHSTDMATRNYFSHDTLGGGDFASRITDAGYRWSAAAENIAAGQRTAEAVMTAWMNSSGHRANILNCNYQEIGVGVAANAGGTLYWTQDFARPR